MSDETTTTEPTETPDAPEAEPELVETEESAEAAAPEPEQSAVARVALKKARKLERQSAKRAEAAERALSEAKALSEGSRADRELVAALRDAKTRGDYLAIAQLVGLDGEAYARQAIDADTPEARAEARFRKLQQDEEARQRQAWAQQTTAQREHAERTFVRAARRDPTIAEVLAPDEDGEAMMADAELVSMARRVGSALKSARLAEGDDTNPSDSEILTALSAKLRKRLAGGAPAPAPDKRVAAKPLAGDARARASGPDDPPDDPAGMRKFLRAQLEAATNLERGTHNGGRTNHPREHQ